MGRARVAQARSEIPSSLHEERTRDMCSSLGDEHMMLETRNGNVVPGEIRQTQSRYCLILPSLGTQSIRLLRQKETGGCQRRGLCVGVFLFNADGFSFAR